MSDFETAYQSLNKEQKRAVDTIDGPVMVVAGPGTGKTQVLALRIAHILEQTDVGADAVLCLTFTRSGVSAMRKRLERYIRGASREVHVNTFHSFAGDLVDKYYQLLDFDIAPRLLSDTEAVLLVDELLHEHEWEYIRPRTNPSQYFGDLRGLISILKREQMSPAMFLSEVEQEIVALEQDPDSISSRGESKGKLKKEIEKKIESLMRTKEVVAFYRLYEEQKKSRGFMDYDDVLEYAVVLAESTEDVRADIREAYQYILIDEHQDSSGVQNAFLKAVWQGVEQPNIFVVGDDRQLIYGFSGASFSYFESFAHLFGKATLITLVENYRSTERILALADDLLQSSVTTEKLKSNTAGDHSVLLSEFSYERDEILGAAAFFKEQIEAGAKPEDCALLVPKNRHVRSAINILRDRGLPVSSVGGSSFFSVSETQSIRRVLKIIADPFDSVSLAESVLDVTSAVAPMEAHRFLHTFKYKNIELSHLTDYGHTDGLFAGEHSIAKWGKKLSGWIEGVTHDRLSVLVSTIGNELLIQQAKNHEALLRAVEVVRSLLHVVLLWEEKHTGESLGAFLSYIDRLEEYGQQVELASFGAVHGIQVMTLHKSKGLEYECVWIAHMNEQTLMAEKRQAFTLPESIKVRMAERDVEAVKRELYVAITRAKQHCAISYATAGYDGREFELAEIIADLPQVHFTKRDAVTNEQALLTGGPEQYVETVPERMETTIAEVQDFVREHYEDTKVSVTLLNNFFECPWKWYFRNFLKLPEVKSVSLALGSAVHSTLEYILKSETKPSAKLITEKIHDALAREGVTDTKEMKRLAKDAELAVVNWMEHYYSDLAKDRTSERSVSYRDPAFPNLSMYGKIDLTERSSSGDIVVTDFKTGSVKTAGMIEKVTDEGRLSDYMRQLAMYSYLVRGAEKKDVTHSRLLFVEADKEKFTSKSAGNALYETHIENEQIDLLIRDIKDYDKALREGIWTDQECHYKPYGTQTECEYCKLAKIFKK